MSLWRVVPYAEGVKSLPPHCFGFVLVIREDKIYIYRRIK